MINRREVLIGAGAAALTMATPAIAAPITVERFWEIVQAQPGILGVRWVMPDRHNVYLSIPSRFSWTDTWRKLASQGHAGLPPGYQIGMLDYWRMLEVQVEVAINPPVDLLKLLPTV